MRSPYEVLDWRAMPEKGVWPWMLWFFDKMIGFIAPVEGAPPSGGRLARPGMMAGACPRIFGNIGFSYAPSGLDCGRVFSSSCLRYGSAWC